MTLGANHVSRAQKGVTLNADHGFHRLFKYLMFA